MREALFKITFILIALALFSAQASGLISEAKMQIFAVTSEGNGLSADLVLKISQGTGKIWSSVDPLVGTTTQSAERVAIEVTRSYYPRVNDYDYKFEIDSNASLVEGPSAGSAMALLAITMLRDKRIPSYVGLTGTISKDGFIGPVGGIFEKAKYASQQGIRLFLIPMGEAKQVAKVDNTLKTVNIREYALQNWGMKVIEVKNIEEAMTYAFLDFNSVDVNLSSQESLPDFAPAGEALPKQLLVMRELNKRYIEEAKQEIRDAKSSLSTTLLEDADLVNLLLESLNESEKTVRQAELLYDQNYLYSSANYVFLTKVNARLVADIAENPSLVSENSAIFQKKVSELSKQAEDLKAELSEFIPIEGLEWHVSAQQRLTWAILNVEKLKSTETIVVGAGSRSDAYYNAIFQKIQDYEFAAGWIGVANDLHEISKNSAAKALPDDFFKSFNDKQIKDASSVLDSISSDDLEDAARRLDASKKEKDLEWHLASAMDSASAIALLNANYDSKALDLKELQAMLSEKIASAERGISSSGHKFVWAELYLAHSKYFLESSKFYEGHANGALATSNARNGLSLAMLANSLYETTEEIYDYYDSGKQKAYSSYAGPLSGTGQNGAQNTAQNPALLLATIILSAAALIVLVFAVARIGLARRLLSKGPDLQKLRRLQIELDRQFIQGQVSEEKHSELSRNYKREIALLEDEKRSKSREVIELDLLKSELLAFERALRELKVHYKGGLVVPSDYNDNLRRYQLKIGQLKEAVARERESLKQEGRKLSGAVEKAQKSPEALKSIVKSLKRPKPYSKQRRKRRT